MLARALTLTGALLAITVGCAGRHDGPPLTADTPATTGIASSSGNEEHPPPDDVEMTGCGSGALGPSATGTLTNPSSNLSNYMIQVNFLDVAGTIVASGTAFVNSVPSGSTATWQADSFDMDATADTCAVVKVDRYSAE